MESKNKKRSKDGKVIPEGELKKVVTEGLTKLFNPDRPEDPTADRPAGLREMLSENMKVASSQRNFFENVIAADIIDSRNEKRAEYNRQQTLATDRQHFVSTMAHLAAPLLVNSIGQQFAQIIDHRDLSYDKMINIDEQIWAVLALALGALSKPVYQDAVMALMIAWLTEKGYTVIETTTETTKE